MNDNVSIDERHRDWLRAVANRQNAQRYVRELEQAERVAEAHYRKAALHQHIEKLRADLASSEARVERITRDNPTGEER